MMNHNGNAIRNYHTTSKEEAARLGLSLAGLFVPGDVVLLKGDLGAGKTTASRSTSSAPRSIS